jgi:GTPase SAR1 family protein
VGDTGVGKTHLLNKYVKGVLPRNPVPTIGVEFATKTVTLKNGERVKAQIWDTGKQATIFSRTVTVSIDNNGVQMKRKVGIIGGLAGLS